MHSDMVCLSVSPKGIRAMLKVAITGGPSSGKSSGLSRLESALTERGYKVFVIPETPTELIVNGIKPSEELSLDDFQNFVLDKQLGKEKLYERLVSYFPEDKIVILCDRGILDQLAYTSREYMESMLSERGMTLTDALNRYDGVIHLVTAANGAEDFYKWNNPDLPEGDRVTYRSETPQQARALDIRTMEGWVGHPHLRVIGNETDFSEKMNKVVEEIFNMLGEPTPSEVERKFLIRMPDVQALESMELCSRSNIIQTYLEPTTSGVERRVRQRGTPQDGYSFYYTEKQHSGSGERVEVERRITVHEYIDLLAEAEIGLHQISKQRYCFVYDHQYFELDVYPFSDSLAILEIELNDINQDVRLPDFIEVVKEVTDDSDYKNHELARTMRLR